MPRPPTSPPLSPVLQELDYRFVGLNERDDAGALEGQGGSFAVAAVNMRFRTGEPETRDGYVKPVPLRGELFHGDGGNYLGAGTFVDLSGREWVALPRLADYDPGIYILEVLYVRMGESPQRINAPQDMFVVDEPVFIMQAGEEMILWRPADEPLHWDGDFASTWETAALATIPAEYPTFLVPLPVARFGLWAADRVVFPYLNGIGFTGIFEPRRWDQDNPDNSIFIEGAGPVTGLARLGSALIVFKETSISAVTNFAGDLADTELEQITTQAGCIAHATITQVGGGLIWLGRGGVYQLSEVLKNSAAGGLTVRREMSSVPLSWLIPKTMGRVNWNAASRAVATLADGLWYLAVPVDGSTVNNALFVFDTVTGHWQGEDVLEAWSAEDFRGLVRTTVFGQESPIVVGDLAVYAGGHGWHDGFGSGDIRTAFTGRGYVMEEHGLKAVQSLEVLTEELGTSGVSLRAAVDGIRTVQDVQLDQTRDRSQYLAWGRAARDLDNSDDDFEEAGREDYAWMLGEMQVETLVVACASGAVTGSGNAAMTLTSAVVTGSPLSLPFAVLLGDTTADVATKLRAKLNATAAVTDEFTIGGSGVNVTLTAKDAAANDTTLLLALSTGTATGITTASSSNTTAGGAGDGLSLGDNGVPLGYLQQHKLMGSVCGVSRWLQPRVAATGGKVRIKAVRATGRPREDVRAML